MIAHTWKFAEIKEILFLLLLISLCFIAINGAPVTKKMKFTPKDGMLGNNHARSAVIIPKMHDASVKFIFNDDLKSNGLFVMFSGSNVETSTFLVESTDEEKLREKFSKWKSELDFLKSHHIIPFHFTKESMEPTNSENIFREIFGIQPVTLRLSASELAETGLIYCNSMMMARKNPGSVYAIVGYKKF
uniref:Uncharacterized protein n=1 Tax=Onchocerca volvulus TaxID=6282 RepID=A0A8R1TM57_ONCVO